MRKAYYLFPIMTILLLWGCATDLASQSDHRVIRENGRVFIVDVTGKHWDVTHAESAYGMKAENFQYGIGPNAIRPILNPTFHDSSHSLLDRLNPDHMVIGFERNGDKRAYPISVLSRHEVADDLFDSTHVAVAY